MREFNIFGPVNPQRHYHVNRVAVKAALREKIEKGRYLTLTAGRQTGKTTLFREIIAELEATGNYFGILLDIEALASFEEARFFELLSRRLDIWRNQHFPSAPEALPMRDYADFAFWLQRIAQEQNSGPASYRDSHRAFQPSALL